MEGVGERVHAKIKTVSEARFEEEQRDSAGRERKDVRYRAHTPLFLCPPPPPLCHSFERNDVRSGLFIVVKNTSKCPSSPACDKGQPPPLCFTLVAGIGYSHESGFDRFSSSSIPWFPLSQLCSDRRTPFAHVNPWEWSIGLCEEATKKGTTRRGKEYRKGAKVIEPFLSSPDLYAPHHSFHGEKPSPILLSLLFVSFCTFPRLRGWWIKLKIIN